MAKFLQDGSIKCQMSISARESKSPKSCCSRCQLEDGVGRGGDYCARKKLLDHLITGDETWLRLSTPETKHVSMTRKHPSSPVTKSSKFSIRQHKWWPPCFETDVR
ncbi:hypothetical protein ElyMa_002197700 [Elysia marginata]|uniref:Uncharacterized protein n=1 Tax=Elysia marginata TaxID=1093978 RepID=A0AAV4FS65_9GAST|nr:hypothetical protein ElyMa_002197700 [Elysia marginata]